MRRFLRPIFLGWLLRRAFLLDLARVFPQVCCRILAADFALPKLLHHLSVFDALGSLQLMTVLFEEITGRIERGSLVPIHKGMVASDSLGIAGRKLESVAFTIGVLVLRSCERRTSKAASRKPCEPPPISITASWINSTCWRVIHFGSVIGSLVP